MRTMRFNSRFPGSDIFNWWAPPNSLLVRKLSWHKYCSSTVRPLWKLKVIDEVPFLMDDNDITYLKERTNAKSEQELIGMIKETDLALTCSRFPCIKLGDSPLIELYEERVVGPTNPDPKFVKRDKLAEAWHCLGQALVKPKPLSLNGESLSLSSPILEGSQGVTEVEESSNSKDLAHEIRVSGESVLDKSIRSLPGLTSRQASALEDGGFHTVRKLLNHYPRTYADLQNAQGHIEEGHYFMFVGRVLSSKGIRAGSSFAFLEVVVGCIFQNTESNSKSRSEERMIYLHLKQFFRGRRFTCQPFLKKIESKYKEGDHVHVSGKVKKTRSEYHYEMAQYNIDILDEQEERYSELERRPYPLYPSKAGLKPNLIGEYVSRALQTLTYDIDPMPPEILTKFNLLNLYDAYMGIHRPKTVQEADSARRRLIFDEFFYLQLGRLFQMLEALGTRIERERLLDKYKNHEVSTVCMDEWSPLTRKFLEALPYSLTPSQLGAISEIILDLKRPVPMSRLLQGDVGCGKTVVALLACMEVIASGFQAAFMAPTELLAFQHYELLNSYLENIKNEENLEKPKIALLTGSTSTRESRLILKGIQTGEIAMVIGTHSLISEKIEYSALRIAVIDEQHRFGVVQRGRFNNKLFSLLSRLKEEGTNIDETSEEGGERVYMAPHILAMSATPIPRTLALALYGDMSLTQITDLPPGRQPIETLALEGNETGFQKVFQMMKEELAIGGKVYLVYPIIEESEQLPQLHAAAADFEAVKGKFEGYECGLLHGRLKPDDKEAALRRFREGGTRVLLATQVIEIGVDVPDASMMVVINAERFGIAQLHQLRGRVGRGDRKSRCILLSSTAGALERLKVLERSSDGFHLANADLLLRGPGNLLGKKQSGHLPEFPVARLEVDGDILQESHLAALKILGVSNDLEKYPGLKAELSMRQPLCILGD